MPSSPLDSVVRSPLESVVRFPFKPNTKARHLYKAVDEVFVELGMAPTDSVAAVPSGNIGTPAVLGWIARLPRPTIESVDNLIAMATVMRRTAAELRLHSCVYVGCKAEPEFCGKCTSLRSCSLHDTCPLCTLFERDLANPPNWKSVVSLFCRVNPTSKPGNLATALLFARHHFRVTFVCSDAGHAKQKLAVFAQFLGLDPACLARIECTTSWANGSEPLEESHVVVDTLNRVVHTGIMQSVHQESS